MPLCVNSACSRELSLGALFCDYCQTPGRSLGADADAWQSGVRLVGKTLKDRYRIEGVLRADETGILYAAVELSTSTEVALRLLPRKIASSPERLQVLSACATATEALDHVNLIPSLGMDAEGTDVCLLYPRVEGESVARYLDRRMHERGVAGLPPEEALLILEGVADGLDALHRRGLVHRGLRPAVVVLTHENGIIVPRLSEVGIAGHLRIFLSRLGKPEHFPFPYSSPEEMKGGVANKGWDLFALGCLAWELLLGRTPFPGMDRAQRILAGNPEGAAKLDDPIRAVLTKALDPDPADRWPSGRPFVEALGRVLPRNPDRPALRFLASARALPKLPSFEAPPPAPRRATPWGGLAALVLGAGALITWTFQNPQSGTSPRVIDMVAPYGGPAAPKPSGSASPAASGAPASPSASPVKPSPSPAAPTGWLTWLITPSPAPNASPGGSPSLAPSASPTASAAAPSGSPFASASAGPSAPTTATSASPSPLTSGPPPELVPLGKNPQGFHEFRASADGARLVLIPRGAFWMGSSEEDEGPPHEVWLSAFLIDRTEVTAGQFRKYLTESGLPEPAALAGQADAEPAGGLSWLEAQDYLKWAGRGLPTEAQWEKAARGGVAGQPYPWGEAPPTGRACFGLSLDSGKPRPVGSFEPNGFGLCDVAGNVWEWCLDAFDPDAYRTVLGRDPIAEPRGEFKVIRGGCYADAPPALRVSARNRLRATMKGIRGIGFRGVRPWKGREP